MKIIGTLATYIPLLLFILITLYTVPWPETDMVISNSALLWLAVLPLIGLGSGLLIISKVHGYFRIIPIVGVVLCIGAELLTLLEFWQPTL